jgi:hypothetical protein
MTRVYNFAAGPSTLPTAALKEAAAELVDYRGTGMSLIEMSHRGGHYDAVHREAISLVRELLAVPADYHILFLQGGATMQFAMVPLAFLGGGVRRTISLPDTGRNAPTRTRRLWVMRAFSGTGPTPLIPEYPRRARYGSGMTPRMSTCVPMKRSEASSGRNFRTPEEHPS